MKNNARVDEQPFADHGDLPRQPTVLSEQDEAVTPCPVCNCDEQPGEDHRALTHVTGNSVELSCRVKRENYEKRTHLVLTDPDGDSGAEFWFKDTRGAKP